MSRAKRLINRAIELLLQGQSEGAENALEHALGEVDKLIIEIKQKPELPPHDDEKEKLYARIRHLERMLMGL